MYNTQYFLILFLCIICIVLILYNFVSHFTSQFNSNYSTINSEDFQIKEQVFPKLQNSPVFSSLNATRDFLKEYENKTSYHKALNLPIPAFMKKSSMSTKNEFVTIPLLWQSLNTLYEQFDDLTKKTFCQSKDVRTLLESRSSSVKEEEQNTGYIKCNPTKETDLQFTIPVNSTQYDGVNGLFYKLKLNKVESIYQHSFFLLEVSRLLLKLNLEVC